MPLTLAQIENEVDTLPTEEKFQLFEHLQCKLIPEQDELDRIWAEEADRRYQAIKSGKTKTIPMEEVFAKLEAKFGKR